MANTSYETVFAEFKDKITDPDLITFAEELQTEMLTAYMKKAIGKCKRVVKTVDLSNRDDELMQFGVEIPDEVNKKNPQLCGFSCNDCVPENSPARDGINESVYTEVKA